MTKTRAEIITIGDEILYGQILDTNSQWISEALDRVGIKTIRKTTISDEQEDILNTFAEAEKRADIILITGGLGPTNDDLTKPCLAKYFDCKIEMNEDALHDVQSFFESRGKELTEINRQQAALPVCCERVQNTLGTAPGMWFHINDKVFVSMPGVPHEMKKMMNDTVIPRLKEVFNTEIIYHKIIKTIGIGESWLSEKIKDWEDNLPKHIKLAYLPSLGQVKLRLTAKGENHEQLVADVEKEIEKLKEYAAKYIYGYNNDQIELAVGNLLKDSNKTLAIAESCTGGYVSHLITSVPGSSSYYMGSLIPYQNEHKINILGVKAETIEQHGAVSQETVEEMAERVRELFNTDIGISTSGIAGPGGGTPTKPVGTIWIGYSDGSQTISRKLQLTKEREINIKGTAVALLNMIRISFSKTMEISS